MTCCSFDYYGKQLSVTICLCVFYVGLLEHEDGSILKALQKAPRGTRELDFYGKVYDATCADKYILQLQQYLPGFRGAFHFEEYPEGTLKTISLFGTFYLLLDSCGTN